LLSASAYPYALPAKSVRGGETATIREWKRLVSGEAWRRDGEEQAVVGSAGVRGKAARSFARKISEKGTQRGEAGEKGAKRGGEGQKSGLEKRDRERRLQVSAGTACVVAWCVRGAGQDGNGGGCWGGLGKQKKRGGN